MVWVSLIMHMSTSRVLISNLSILHNLCSRLHQRRLRGRLHPPEGVHRHRVAPLKHLLRHLASLPPTLASYLRIQIRFHFSHSGYERYDRARYRNTSNPVLHVRRRFETALNVVQLAGPWSTTMTAPLWSSSAPPPSVESPTCVTFA